MGVKEGKEGEECVLGVKEKGRWTTGFKIRMKERRKDQGKTIFTSISMLLSLGSCFLYRNIPNSHPNDEDAHFRFSEEQTFSHT